MRHLLYRLFLILVLAGLAAPAWPAEPATGAPATETKDLERLVDTLEDDAKRQALVRDLRALIAAQKQAEAQAEEPIGTRLLETLSGKIEDVGKQLADAAAALVNIPKLAQWVRAGITNPQTRAQWLSLVVKLTLIVVAGLAAEWLALWVLRRPRASLESQTADGFWLHLVFAVMRTMLDLIAIAAFAGAAYGAMTLLSPARDGQVLALALINASIVARAVTAVARMVLAPRVSPMRLLPLQDETANYAFVWIRRLTNITVYGFLVIEALPSLGMPLAAYTVLMKLLGLLIVLLLIMLVMQNRQQVAQHIRGQDGRDWGQFRNRLADIWHLPLIVYLVAAFGVWAFEVPGGFELVLRATVLSLVIVAVASAVVVVSGKAIRHGFSLSEEQKARFPGLETRANRYLPILVSVTRAIIYGAAVLAVLQVWGLRIFGWLATPVGATLVTRILTIGMIIVIALVVWEMVSIAIERYLTATDREGNAVTRGQRAQTLLPLLRNVVLIVLAIMVTLTILSEIGINIGPLIAGAGIFGLAIGFGAQTFVKDVITGFFILVEDTMSVGDIVELGGHAGKVEAMSIRSIRLRDVRGQVHRIPFSAVTTTVNRSKDFSYAFFEIGVAYREDVDRCMNVIREVGAEMRADPLFAPTITGDMEIMGVQSFADSAVVIRARMKVQPGKHAAIQRAFNRLLKNRFDADGIEIPFPHRTLYFGVDSQGDAPPAHLLVTQAESRAAATAKPKPKVELTKRPEGESGDVDETPDGSDVRPPTDSP